jgi:Leucine-rich repeat (LRR) protein
LDSRRFIAYIGVLAALPARPIEKKAVVPRPRRLFRISLRALLALLTILCLWFGKISIEARRQKEAVEWVLKNGGEVYYDTPPEPIAGQFPQRKRLAPEWIQRLLGVDYCRSVTVVVISNPTLSDISPLAKLTHLESLNLLGNDISDVVPLSKLTKLKILVLVSNDVSDLSPLALLTNLTTLEVSSNEVSDLSPLRGLKRLRTLGAMNNQIQDMSAVGDLTNLEQLTLTGNQITDWSPLLRLSNLKVVMIGPITEEEKGKLQTALPNLKIAAF